MPKSSNPSDPDFVADPADAPEFVSLDLPHPLDDLLERGNGVLVRHGVVWSYPGVLMDPSGTNLRLPLHSIPHAVVQEAVDSGDLVVRSVDASGGVTSVARKSEDDERPIRVFNLAQAGSVEAGTEVPLNSRPTHDACKRLGDPEKIVLPTTREPTGLKDAKQLVV